jgi:hypothetical protein
METQFRRDILNRSGGLQSDAKHNQQYHMVVLYAPSPTPLGALPSAWAHSLNQLHDELLVDSSLPGHDGGRRSPG